MLYIVLKAISAPKGLRFRPVFQALNPKLRSIIARKNPTLDSDYLDAMTAERMVQIKRGDMGRKVEEEGPWLVVSVKNGIGFRKGDLVELGPKATQLFGKRFSEYFDEDKLVDLAEPVPPELVGADESPSEDQPVPPIDSESADIPPAGSIEAARLESFIDDDAAAKNVGSEAIDEADLDELIRQAADQMSEADGDYTRGGKPKVDQIRALLKRQDIFAEDRDRALGLK